ncbi:zinc finger protein 560 isoform X3 [Microcaecilia unicolor]|uniref:Zinc finger protein 560-like isoform X3 n=1 Tax=Microcaecilia unicolor TaxID=1415580 RepID=A0A6P7XJV0_9AMPH|nr:zinc finger protein 560-like isoform X3 [Microcaecilia unicolor]
MSLKTSVTFKDVAAYFSEEEWAALEEWQKELYRSVMKEIHAALLSLGYRIVNPDAVFWVKNKLEPNAKWSQDLGEIQSINVSYSNSATPCPDILMRIKTDVESPLSDPGNPGKEDVAGENPSASHTATDPAISVRIKEEEGSCAQDPLYSIGTDCIYSPSTVTGGSVFQPHQFLQSKEEENSGTDPGALGNGSEYCSTTEGGHVTGNGSLPENCTRNLNPLEMAIKNTIWSVQWSPVGEDPRSIQDQKAHPRQRPIQLQKRKNFRRPPQAILPRSSDLGERLDGGAVGNVTTLQINHTGSYVELSWKPESEKEKQTAKSGASPLYKCDVCEKAFPRHSI